MHIDEQAQAVSQWEGRSLVATQWGRELVVRGHDGQDISAPVASRHTHTHTHIKGSWLPAKKRQRCELQCKDQWPQLCLWASHQTLSPEAPVSGHRRPRGLGLLASGDHRPRGHLASQVTMGRRCFLQSSYSWEALATHQISKDTQTITFTTDTHTDKTLRITTHALKGIYYYHRCSKRGTAAFKWINDLWLSCFKVHNVNKTVL